MVYNEKRFSSILEILNELKNYQKIYVFGAGKFSNIIIRGLKKHNISIMGILVSDLKGNPDHIDGIKVSSIYDIDEFEKKRCVVILGISDHRKSSAIDILAENGFQSFISFANPGVLYGVLEKTTRRNLPVLEITSRIGCSVACRYCPQSILMEEYFKKDKERKALLDYEVFRMCIENTPDDCIITFSGFAEPFLNPNIVPMIRHAYDQGRLVELFTTFDGCSIEQFHEIKDIQFSRVVLHEPDSEGLARIRCTPEYWKVIDEVLDWKRSDGAPMCDFATGQGEPSKEFLEHANGRIKINKILHNRAGNLENDSMLQQQAALSGRLECVKSLHQDQWVLLPDGTVTLCCNDFGLKHIIGNLNLESMETIKNRHQYKDIRKKMLCILEQDDLICRECNSARISKG